MALSQSLPLLLSRLQLSQAPTIPTAVPLGWVTVYYQATYVICHVSQAVVIG